MRLKGLNMINKFNKILTATAFAAATTFAAPALASPINVETVHGSVFGDAAGQNQWKIVTQFEVDGKASGGVYAGAFRLESDATGALSDFLAFCLQPLETLTLPKEHNVGSKFSESVTANLNILAANAWGSVTDSVTAAAFQMAAWEITTETDAKYDINDGNFAIINQSAKSNQAEGTAQLWLNNIQYDHWTSNGEEFVILNAPGTQDLLTNVSAVPLPASGLLLLGGLFGTGAIARRKAKKA